jgi:hypothetical protein
VHTPAELGAALKGLARGRSYGELIIAAKGLGKSLRKSTLAGLFTGHTSEPTLSAYLTVCGLDSDLQERWIRAWARTRAPEAVRILTEIAMIETAPPYAEMTDAWLTRREHDCHTADQAPLGEQIRREVAASAGVLAECMRILRQIPGPADAQGKADPVTFAGFVSDSLALTMRRFKKASAARRRAGTNDQAPGGFDQKVAAHLQECHQVLHQRAFHAMAGWPGCALRLRLANLRDPVISGAVVRLSLPGGVQAIDPATVHPPAPGLPPQPSRVNTSSTFTVHDLFAEDLGLLRQFARAFTGEQKAADYKVIGSETSTVEFGGVDLPGNGSVALPPVPVVIDEPTEKQLLIHWTVTGSAVHERFSGKLGIPVTASTLSLEDVFPPKP